jgi:hypothetical protein
MQSIKLPPLVQQFLDEVTLKVNPDFKIRNKGEPDAFYRIISKVVGLFNKNMDTGYITVINGTCWFPASFFSPDGKEFTCEPNHAIKILAHETVHEYDRKRLGTVPFTLIYLFPQVLAVLSLLAVLALWNPHWLLCLFFLLFLTPIPAPGRAWLEVRGYKTNMSLGRLKGWDPNLLSFQIVRNNFMSGNYYFMMPFFGWTAKRLLDFTHESEDIYAKIIIWYKSNAMEEL